MSVNELRHQADQIINDLEGAIASMNIVVNKLQSATGGLVLIGISGGQATQIGSALRLSKFADDNADGVSAALLQMKTEVLIYRERL